MDPVSIDRMPRRASSRFRPAAWLVVAVVLAAVVAIVRHGSGGPDTAFADVARLDLSELLENGNSLRGNEYAVEGQIDEKLVWSADRGQVVSLRVGTPSGDEFIAIEVPPGFDRLNLDVRQDYRFRVRFRDGGIAVATGIERL